MDKFMEYTIQESWPFLLTVAWRNVPNQCGGRGAGLGTTGQADELVRGGSAGRHSPPKRILWLLAPDYQAT